MTLNELIGALNRIEPKYGNLPVSIWLPGSRIDLRAVMGDTRPVMDGEVLIEGNVRPGSALDNS